MIVLAMMFVMAGGEPAAQSDRLWSGQPNECQKWRAIESRYEAARQKRQPTAVLKAEMEAAGKRCAAENAQPPSKAPDRTESTRLWN